MDGLAKSFGETKVLHDVSIKLGEGEVLALLGLSGSGKTTALRLLAGFEQPDRGTIHVGGHDVTSMAPEKRGFGMVFQHYALFPHMTVAQNVAFGLESRGWDAVRAARRIDEMLALVNLEGYGERRVSAISGGQQQRVALARALAPEPKLLLLDEPLSNLDPALRERTRDELRAAVRRIGITTVLVTHEQEEAFHVGDQIAVLHHGRLHQVGPAGELYRRPATPFVASFIGRSTSLPATVVDVDADGTVNVRPAVAPGSQWPAHGAAELEPGAGVDWVVRPEALALTGADGAEMRGTVREIRFVGHASYAFVELDGMDRAGDPVLQVWIDPAAPEPVVGEAVGVVRRPSGPMPRVFPASEPA